MAAFEEQVHISCTEWKHRMAMYIVLTKIMRFKRYNHIEPRYTASVWLVSVSLTRISRNFCLVWLKHDDILRFHCITKIAAFIVETLRWKNSAIDHFFSPYRKCDSNYKGAWEKKFVSWFSWSFVSFLGDSSVPSVSWTRACIPGFFVTEQI